MLELLGDREVGYKLELLFYKTDNINAEIIETNC